MNNLIGKLLSGIVGIGISAYLLDGVTFDGSFQTILLVGAVMGLLMFFVKPIFGIDYPAFKNNHLKPVFHRHNDVFGLAG